MTKAEIAIMCLQSMTRNDDVLLFHRPSYLFRSTFDCSINKSNQ